jgi:hypothetical protein
MLKMKRLLLLPLLFTLPVAAGQDFQLTNVSLPNTPSGSWWKRSWLSPRDFRR